MPIEDPCVIRLLAEGAAIQLHGHKEPDGTWRFVGWSGAMNIEEDGNDSVQAAGIQWCGNLSDALPRTLWIRFMPMHVHPDLREWFRSRYAVAVAALPDDERERHREYRHHLWEAMFQSTPPDRWSEDDAS